MKQTDKEYAEALFMLAAEEQRTAEFETALDTVKAVIDKNPDYIEFLVSPAIPLFERVDAIEQAFGKTLPEDIVSFIKLLCENGHIRSLPECIAEYKRLVMALDNKAFADIYSAVDLSDQQKATVCSKLKKLTGKEIEPRYIIDRSLIGGLKIEIEGKTYDGSVKHRLHDLKDVIIG